MAWHKLAPLITDMTYVSMLIMSSYITLKLEVFDNLCTLHKIKIQLPL